MKRTSSCEGSTSRVIASSHTALKIAPWKGHVKFRALRSSIAIASGTLIVTGSEWIATNQVKITQLCFALAASGVAACIAYVQEKKQDEFRNAIDKLLNGTPSARPCECKGNGICNCPTVDAPDSAVHTQDQDPTASVNADQSTTPRSS